MDDDIPTMTGFDPSANRTPDDYDFIRPLRPAGEIYNDYLGFGPRAGGQTEAELWEEFLHTPIGIQGLRDQGEHEKAALYEAESKAFQEWWDEYSSDIRWFIEDDYERTMRCIEEECEECFVGGEPPQLYFFDDIKWWGDLDLDRYDRQGYTSSGTDPWGWDEDGWEHVEAGVEHHATHMMTGETRDAGGFDFWGLNEDGYDRLGHKATEGDLSRYDRQGYDFQGFDRAGFDRKGWSRGGHPVLGGRYNAIHRDTGTIYGPDGYTLHWGDSPWEVARDKDGFDRRGFDRKGYDRDGYNENGFNRAGYHRATGTKFDEFHLDAEGYDVNGRKAYLVPKTKKVVLLDREGFDARGLDIDGFDRKGRKNGFDKHTLLHYKTGTRFNPQGRDIRGLDAEGRNKSGNKVKDAHIRYRYNAYFDGMPAGTTSVSTSSWRDLEVRRDWDEIPPVEKAHEVKMAQARERWAYIAARKAEAGVK